MSKNKYKIPVSEGGKIPADQRKAEAAAAEAQETPVTPVTGVQEAPAVMPEAPVTEVREAPAAPEVAAAAPEKQEAPAPEKQEAPQAKAEEEPQVKAEEKAAPAKDFTNAPLCLSGRHVTKVFGFGEKKTIAVNDVSFDFHEGEFVSIVGESGSGKTTLSKILLGLLSHTEGEILFQGKPRDISSGRKRNAYWKGIQAIFQDPFSSYNSFHKIDSVLLDCINMRGGKKLPMEKKIEMMTEACSFVNLKFAELTNKYPFELSGGQMQRLMIARIFLLKPKILLADEPTSMVDACSRATILDMLLQLRDEIGMTIIFITHDIGLAYYISDTVYIMEHGKFVEYGKADEVILNPKAAYTKRLISDVPKIHEEWDLSTVDLLGN